MGQIIVRCPNGKTYNLSCALRNANLDYFRLISEVHVDLLLALQKQLNPKDFNISLLVGNRLTEAGDLHSIYRIEEEAIYNYSEQKGFHDINALLRGSRLTTLSDAERKKLIVTALLAISGVNKNVSPVSEKRGSTQLIRYIDTQLPAGLASEMVRPYGLQRLSGFNSFSAASGGSSEHQQLRIKLIIQDDTGKRGIEKVARYSYEGEVLFSPMHLMYAPAEKAHEDSQHFTVQANIVHGLATETTYQYIVSVRQTTRHQFSRIFCGNNF